MTIDQASFVISMYLLVRVEEENEEFSLRLNATGRHPRISTSTCIDDYAKESELYYLPEHLRIDDKILYSNFKDSAHINALLEQGKPILVYQFRDINPEESS